MVGLTMILFLGQSLAYLTSSNQEAKAEAKEKASQTWGYGEGGVDLKAETPWYNYDGYTTQDASFPVDDDFVQALKYDNVTINGYKVDPDAYKEFDHSKMLYDTTINFNEQDEVVLVKFDTKPDTISKTEFKHAHQSNDILTEGETPGDVGSFVRYETNKSYYNVYFDKQGDLYQIEIH
ncbi:immunodominant staphylococcal antigen IsaB family protein [Staphylococcus pseudoxylosus]|uniref:immunodominant staphylococcal antigen IsaB family protein n=1 Tax=Staphylococcus pseudoxylosus TaxID=2282419 RepID=UPI00398A5380